MGWKEQHSLVVWASGYELVWNHPYPSYLGPQGIPCAGRLSRAPFQCRWGIQRALGVSLSLRMAAMAGTGGRGMEPVVEMVVGKKERAGGSWTCSGMGLNSRDKMEGVVGLCVPRSRPVADVSDRATIRVHLFQAQFVQVGPRCISWGGRCS